MTQAVECWFALSLVFLVFSWLVVHRVPSLRLQVLTVVTAGVVAPFAAFACVAVTSGYATVPLNGFSLPTSNNIPIIGVKLDVGNAIYLLLDVEHGPRLYAYPWDEKSAEKLQQMMQDKTLSGMQLNNSGAPSAAAGHKFGELGSRVDGVPQAGVNMPTKDETPGQMFSIGG